MQIENVCNNDRETRNSYRYANSLLHFEVNIRDDTEMPKNGVRLDEIAHKSNHGERGPIVHNK